MIKLTIFLLVAISIIVKAECYWESRTENSCEKRQIPGLICLDCNTLANCLFLDNKWITVHVETCHEAETTTTPPTTPTPPTTLPPPTTDIPEGFFSAAIVANYEPQLFCNLFEKNCSSSSGACNQIGHEEGFKCQMAGIFPNPYDCQTYHFCALINNELQVSNVQCEGSTAYSVVTNACTHSLNDEVCTEKQFNCTRAGDLVAWPENHNIFYMCIAKTHEILFPIFYRCPTDQVFVENVCLAA